MKAVYPSLLLTLGALAIAGTAYTQVPASNDTSDANSNTGMGTNALGGPSATGGGSENTAAGFDAMKSNTSGNFNTGFGDGALSSNTTGSENTAFGVATLVNAATATDNTALGFQALLANTGNDNTATGANALFSNRNGNDNTASGYEALFSNTTGNVNTASGYQALYANTIGAQNSAFGQYALHGNSRGDDNAALGGYALYSNTSGSSNIALGFKAAYFPTAGANNIHIGNFGAAADTKVIKIGTQGTQTATFVAGIEGTTVASCGNGCGPVFVGANGQLGLQASSERFKTEIESMADTTDKLERLRPVTFRYKTEPHGARQYGLIAEQVAQVYPELVVRDAKGQILSVRYDELAPMLLNEVQQQQQKIATQDAHSAAQDARIDQLTRELAEVHAALRIVQGKEEAIAQQ